MAETYTCRELTVGVRGSEPCESERHGTERHGALWVLDQKSFQDPGLI